MGKGGRNCCTNARIFPRSTSSERAALSKSRRSKSRYSSAMCGTSSRQGSHHEAQKLTSVTFPANRESVTVSPPRPGSANAGANGSRASAGAAGAAPSSESPSNVASPPPPAALTATAVSRGPRCRVATLARGTARRVLADLVPHQRCVVHRAVRAHGDGAGVDQVREEGDGGHADRGEPFHGVTQRVEHA